MNKTNERTETSPNSDAIKFKRQESLPLHNHSNLPTSFEEEMDRDYFHWGATAEIMQIIQRREKSPETRWLVERRLEIALFNCDKNVDNFGSVPLLALQGLTLAGPGAPLDIFFWVFDFRVL